MKRHGNFDALPNVDATLTVEAARREHAEALTDLDACEGIDARNLPPETQIGVETSTGSLMLTDPTTGVNWVYFPGEGWDGY
jgi:hypothetical protein